MSSGYELDSTAAHKDTPVPRTLTDNGLIIKCDVCTVEKLLNLIFFLLRANVNECFAGDGQRSWPCTCWIMCSNPA